MKDKTGAMNTGMIFWIIGILVAVVVFSSLWVTIQDSFSDVANVSSGTNSSYAQGSAIASLANIAPLLIIVALILSLVFGIKAAKK